MLIAVEMKAVVVEVDAIMDSNTIDLHVTAFEHSHAVICAAGEEHVAQREPRAAIEDRKVRAIAITQGSVPTRARIVAFAGIELVAMAVDCATPFNGDVLGIRGVEHDNVAVVGWDSFTRGIILRIRAAKQTAGRREVKRHVALQFDRADDEIAGGNEDRAALVERTRVDGSLDGSGVERVAVAFRAEAPDVISARAGADRAGIHRLRFGDLGRGCRDRGGARKGPAGDVGHDYYDSAKEALNRGRGGAYS